MSVSLLLCAALELPTPLDFNATRECSILAGPITALSCFLALAGTCTQTVSTTPVTPFFCCVTACAPAVIQKLRCYCQLSCKPAPASNKLANPPYAIHNFGWKEGLSNNDDDRIKARDGNLRSPLDLKSISVTASESTRGVVPPASSAALSLTSMAQQQLHVTKASCQLCEDVQCCVAVGQACRC